MKKAVAYHIEQKTIITEVKEVKEEIINASVLDFTGWNGWNEEVVK